MLIMAGLVASLFSVVVPETALVWAGGPLLALALGAALAGSIWGLVAIRERPALHPSAA
jgi:hypothetical protein